MVYTAVRVSTENEWCRRTETIEFVKIVWMRWPTFLAAQVKTSVVSKPSWLAIHYRCFWIWPEQSSSKQRPWEGNEGAKRRWKESPFRSIETASIGVGGFLRCCFQGTSKSSEPPSKEEKEKKLKATLTYGMQRPLFIFTKLKKRKKMPHFWLGWRTGEDE